MIEIITTQVWKDVKIWRAGERSAAYVLGFRWRIIILILQLTVSGITVTGPENARAMLPLQLYDSDGALFQPQLGWEK